MKNPLATFSNENTLYEITLADSGGASSIVVVNTPASSNAVNVFVWQSEQVLARESGIYQDGATVGLILAIEALLGQAGQEWRRRVNYSANLVDINMHATDFGVRVSRVWLNGSKSPICE